MDAYEYDDWLALLEYIQSLIGPVIEILRQIVS